MSPFEIFRRNLKPAMIVLVGLSMFAFVVLPAMDSYLRSGYSGGGGDQKIAQIDGVDVSQSRVEYFTRNHQTTVRFLRDTAEETIRRGGAPRTPGFAFDTRTNQVQQVGINDRPSEFGSVRTMQLAAEATKAGFELDDTAIKSWLSKYTDGTMTDSEILGLLAKTSRNSMGQFHLYEQLRIQLLATVYQDSGSSGLITKQQQALMTPTQQWASFLKLNRQASVNAYGLMVQDFYEETNAKPASAKIQAVYEEGKERYSNSQSPEPAFRKRESATFEFVAADMKSYIDREVEKLSDEEIRAEYDKQLKGGAFTMPENSVDQILKQAEEMKAEVEAKAAEAKMEAAGDASKKSEGGSKEEPAEKKNEPAKEDAAKEKPDVASAAEMKAEKDPAPKDAKKEDAKKVDAKKEVAEKEVAEKEVAEKEVAEKEAGKKDSGADLKKQVDDFQKEIEAAKDAAGDTEADQSSVNRSNGVRLVAFQDDDKVNAEAETKDKAEEVKAEPAVTEQKEEKKDEVKEDAEVKSDEKSDEKASSSEMKAAAAKQGVAADADPKEKADADDAEAKQADEAKVRPFEEVRDQVAQSMVRLKAGTALSDAVAKTRSAMRLYFNKKAIYDSNKSIGQDGEEPVKPDLEKMAADLGLVYGKIGPHDMASIVDEPIANSVELGTSLRDRGPPFTSMMFGLAYMGQELPKQQLYSPLGTVDTQAQRSYMTWKIAEKEEYIPELDEVKEEVIQAIRMNEARDLARAAADELLEKASNGEKLEDLVPEGKKSNYFPGLGPFSWMQSFGFGGAFLGNVPKLDSVGEEFMEKVFTTEAGKLGVAANLPERVIYIVEPTEFQPSRDDLRERFKQPRERMMASTLGNEDAGTVYQGFFESTDKRTGFSYQLPESDE